MTLKHFSIQYVSIQLCFQTTRTAGCTNSRQFASATALQSDERMTDNRVAYQLDDPSKAVGPDAPTSECVILVDSADRQTGISEKLEAHRAGLLHRAFSVLIWDDQGRMLVQKRAAAKYHSGGLWTNTCCGHPRPGEETLAAAHRRLNEEMAIAAPLTALGTITYRAEFENGLTEHEIVHVYQRALHWSRCS